MLCSKRHDAINFISHFKIVLENQASNSIYTHAFYFTVLLRHCSITFHIFTFYWFVPKTEFRLKNCCITHGLYYPPQKLRTTQLGPLKADSTMVQADGRHHHLPPIEDCLGPPGRDPFSFPKLFRIREIQSSDAAEKKGYVCYWGLCSFCLSLPACFCWDRFGCTRTPFKLTPPPPSTPL